MTASRICEHRGKVLTKEEIKRRTGKAAFLRTSARP
jgi:hypothetical protein